MSLSKRISLVFFSQLSSKLIVAVYTVWIIRALTLEDQALYSNFLAVYAFCGSMIFAALNFSLVVYASELKGKTGERPTNLYQQVIALQLGLYGILLLFGTFGSNLIATHLLGNPAFSQAIFYGSLASGGLILTNIIAHIYQGEERFHAYSLFTILRPFAIFLAIGGLVWLEWMNFHRLAIAFAVIQALLAFVYLALMLRRENWRGFRLDFSILQPFLYQSRYLIGFHIFLALFSQLDVFMLSKYADTFELANYGVAYRYYSLLAMVFAAANTVLLPKFTQTDSQDPLYQRRFAKKWMLSTFWVAIPLGLGLAFGQDIFLWLNQAAHYAYAFQLLRILSIGAYISLVLNPLANVLIARKQFAFLALLSGIGLVMNITGNLWVVADYGALGVSWITVLSFGLINIWIAIRVFWK